MATAELNALVQLVTSLGNWILFFWLFMQAQRDLKEAKQAHMDDLRSIAQLDPPPPRYKVPRAYEPPQTALEREKAP